MNKFSIAGKQKSAGQSVKPKGIKGTLGEIKTEGLAAKAAILGMVYGLERLMMNSAQTGQNLPVNLPVLPA